LSKQVTISIPDMKNGRTTVLGLLSAGGYAVQAYFQGGGLSWKEAAGCALWAALCCLVADGKTVNSAESKIDAVTTLAAAVVQKQESSNEPAV